MHWEKFYDFRRMFMLYFIQRNFSTQLRGVGVNYFLLFLNIVLKLVIEILVNYHILLKCGYTYADGYGATAI